MSRLLGTLTICCLGAGSVGSSLSRNGPSSQVLAARPQAPWSSTARMARAHSLHFDTELNAFTTELIKRASLSPACERPAGVRRIATAISTTRPASGGEPEWGPVSVPKKPGETQELAMGGAEERTGRAQRRSGGGKRGKVGGKHVQTPRN